MHPSDRLSPDELYEKIVALNVPMDHHESDLYVRVSPEVAEVLARYRFVKGVTVFTTVEDGLSRLWYCIPFAYQPFWEQRKPAP